MLNLQIIRDNPSLVEERLKIKNFQAGTLISSIIEKDDKRRKLISETESAQAQMNQLSKKIGDYFKQGNKTEGEKARELTSQLKEKIKELQNELNMIQDEVQAMIVQLPNLPHENVPAGTSAKDNLKVREGGPKPVPMEGALPHWDLADKYDIIDFELGNKLTGAGFPVYKGKGAKLQRALITFFLDEAVKAGYTEVMPPLMVNEDSGFGTGQLPDKEGQMYHVQLDNFYLIPTAEVPVTNIFRDVILSSGDLPKMYTAYTPCFRREAGSYGKDVRGLNRLHQFDKVEIVQVQHPEKSYNALEEMVDHVEGLLVKLGLPYRIMKLCGGDMGFTSALTYDMEVYSAAQDKWLEVSSISNFESFQSNRLKLRFKDDGDKKTRFAHTLNGSALALPRIVAALLENNQEQEGIVIPEVLRPYTGFEKI